MKKIVFCVALMLLTATIFGQDSKKFFQKVQTGMIAGVSGTTLFTDIEKPFDLGYCLMANVTAVTPWTYHNLMYGFDNSLKSLSGYFLPRNLDVYTVYSRSLNSGQNYLGLGIEKMLQANSVSFFLFYEGGIDFKGNESLTIGILIVPQIQIWKRK